MWLTRKLGLGKIFKMKAHTVSKAGIKIERLMNLRCVIVYTPGRPANRLYG
jgi:hypothetical protein